MNKWLLVPLIFCILFFSCKTSKNIFGGKVKETTIEELDQKIKENIIVFHTFSGKSKIDLTAPGITQTVNAQIDMIKDSVIGISLRLLGVEGARIKITPDSIHILDRLNQQYIPRPFSYLESNFALPVTFNDLQDLIVGNPVFYNDSKLVLGTSDDKYVLSASKDVYKNTIHLSTEFNIVRMFIEDLLNKRNLTLTYDAFDKIEGRKFAFNRFILIDAENDLTANIVFSKVTFDLPLAFSFNVNSKYERID